MQRSAFLTPCPFCLEKLLKNVGLRQDGPSTIYHGYHNEEMASKADRIFRLVDGKITISEEKAWSMQKEK